MILQTESWKNLKTLIAVFYALLLVATFFISPLSPFAAAHATAAHSGRICIEHVGFGSRAVTTRYLITNTQTGWSFYVDIQGDDQYLSALLEPGVYSIEQLGYLSQDGNTVRSDTQPQAHIEVTPASAQTQRSLLQRSVHVQVEPELRITVRYIALQADTLRPASVA